MDDYFTICQYKTEEPINIEISAPISLGFVLSETSMFPLGPKWLPSKLK